MTRVVVVGGGFGGLLAARGLRRADVQVTLVDRQNFFLFQPLVYQVATGSLSSVEVAIPLRQALRRRRNVHVVLGEVTGFDLEARTVQVDDLPNGEEPTLEYDVLAVAGGLELLVLRPRRVGAARAGAEDPGRRARPARPDPERVRGGGGRGRPGERARPG